MRHQATLCPTLASQAWSPEAASRPLRSLTLALLGTALLTLSAKLQLPFYPVPMTMQTFVVLTLGMALGARLGGATLLLYLAEGAAGLPVFAAGGGPAYLLGPSGGYLAGFVVAAAACGLLAERGWDRSAAGTALAMLIGNALIYVPGLAWLGVLYGWDKPLLEWGLMPFVLGDLLKLALAAAILPFIWRCLERSRPSR